MEDRVILHADMNNCYASIEIHHHPQWRGFPLAVCGSQEDRHGIVLAKSQEAKRFGVKTGEPVGQALTKCPDLLIVPPHYEMYLDYSRRARALYARYTDLVEPFGMDECWMDVTGSQKLFGNGRTIADDIRCRIKKELGITVSVGVSFNKTFAKLGSDLKKPDAVTEIPRDRFRQILDPLPVENMLGVGGSTRRKLCACGICTLGDLAGSDPHFLRKILGVSGILLWHHANGRDADPVHNVQYRAPIRSVGRGVTCRADLVDNAEVLRVLQVLCFSVSQRLREHGLEASGVQLSVRDCDLYTRQFQTLLALPTQSSLLLREAGMALFTERYDWQKPVRALTIRAIHLRPLRTYRQLGFLSAFSQRQKKEDLDAALYALRERFGKHAISFASLFEETKLPADRSEFEIPVRLFSESCLYEGS